MKKKIIILLIILGTVTMSLTVRNRGYIKTEKEIFYNTREITEEYDFDSFIILSYFYAKDKNHVYYMDKILKNSDAGTFELLEDSYPEVLKNYYAKDRQTIVFEDTPIEGADIETFKSLGAGMAQDKNSVYYRGKKLTKIDRKTFRIISVYCSNKDDCTVRFSKFRDKNGIYNTNWYKYETEEIYISRDIKKLLK
jgi:hypothetical protein